MISLRAISRQFRCSAPSSFFVQLHFSRRPQTTLAHFANREIAALISRSLRKTPRACNTRKWRSVGRTALRGKAPLMNCPHVPIHVPPPNYMLIIGTTYVYRPLKCEIAYCPRFRGQNDRRSTKRTLILDTPQLALLTFSWSTISGIGLSIFHIIFIINFIVNNRKANAFFHATLHSFFTLTRKGRKKKREIERGRNIAEVIYARDLRHVNLISWLIRYA